MQYFLLFKKLPFVHTRESSCRNSGAIIVLFVGGTRYYTGIVRRIDLNDVTEDSSNLIPSLSLAVLRKIGRQPMNRNVGQLPRSPVFCATSNVNDAAKSLLIIRFVRIGTSWTFCFGRDKLKKILYINKSIYLNIDIE